MHKRHGSVTYEYERECGENSQTEYEDYPHCPHPVHATIEQVHGVRTLIRTTLPYHPHIRSGGILALEISVDNKHFPWHRKKTITHDNLVTYGVCPDVGAQGSRGSGHHSDTAGAAICCMKRFSTRILDRNPRGGLSCSSVPEKD